MFPQVLLGARPVREKSEELSSLIRAVEGEKGHELNVLTAHRVFWQGQVMKHGVTEDLFSPVSLNRPLSLSQMLAGVSLVPVIYVICKDIPAVLSPMVPQNLSFHNAWLSSLCKLETKKSHCCVITLKHQGGKMMNDLYKWRCKIYGCETSCSVAFFI